MKSSLDYGHVEKDDICILKNNADELSYFRIEGMTSDRRLCIRYGNKPTLIPVDELEKIVFLSDGGQVNLSQRWISDIFNDENAWENDLSVISQDDIENIKLKNKVYYYNRLLRIGKLTDPIFLIPFNMGLLLVSYLLILFVLATNSFLIERNNFVIFLSVIAISILVAWFYSINLSNTLFYVFLGKNLITFFCYFL